MDDTAGCFEEGHCRSAGRATLAGAGFGAAGGALTGSLALLGDADLHLSAELFFGGTGGALVGAVLGTVVGTTGGCLAARLAADGRDRAARTALAVVAGVLTALTALAFLTVEVPALGQALLAGGVAAGLAWVAAPWCLQPAARS
ncbi:hypothetical protein ACFEMC_18330 [Kineococcus sp. DHX-1]|uniref:hypothetical protein n=1 Tax=Kineococcus sp. DHX-1 TaxID=3349638 RepID=UPI0036D303B4